MILERPNNPSDRKGQNARFVIGCLVGVILAAAGFFAYYASGDPLFFGACHSMKTVHARWQTSSHRQFACVECHLPDTHIGGKIAYKTRAGLQDLVSETRRAYASGTGLSLESRRAVNANCFRCHASTIAKTLMSRDGGDCLGCHRFLVHGRGQDEGGIKVEK
jgi:cytochrome c nitrite reductase small subunit